MLRDQIDRQLDRGDAMTTSAASARSCSRVGVCDADRAQSGRSRRQQAPAASLRSPRTRTRAARARRRASSSTARRYGAGIGFARRRVFGRDHDRKERAQRFAIEDAHDFRLQRTRGDRRGPASTPFGRSRSRRRETAPTLAARALRVARPSRATRSAIVVVAESTRPASPRDRPERADVVVSEVALVVGAFGRASGRARPARRETRGSAAVRCWR